MINVGLAEEQAALWGVPLRDWMELNNRVYGKEDVFGDFDLDIEANEKWRGEVADVLIENKLVPRANRFLQCSRYAHTYQCKGPQKHKLFSPIYCDLRFCPQCAPRQFARLVKKYEPILKSVESSAKPGFRFREITLTSRNVGSLSPLQVNEFNLEIKKTLKFSMRKVTGWGAIWCDEVGFDNTNLHAHIIFYGPYISQKELARTWKKISGHQVVWIKESRGSGVKTLLYMLKYVSKPPTNNPRQVGLLEVAFHRIRRIHSVGIFFKFAKKDPDHKNSAWSTCPHCGADIEKEMGSPRVEKAILEGRTFVGTRYTDRRRQWVN